MQNSRTVACAQCDTVIDLVGHVGRPPHSCGEECRRAGKAADERMRRAQRKAEIDRLRRMVAQFEAVLAA